MTQSQREDNFRALSEDYSLIRLAGKAPIEREWPRYCHEKRTYDEIGFRADDNAGIACGPASNLLVLDIDDLQRFESVCQEKRWEMPETRKTRTGGGGYHHYFRYPSDGARYGNKSFRDDGFDIRGDGGQVVAPGSIHPGTGVQYEFENDAALAPAPGWLLELYQTPAEGSTVVELAHVDPEEVDLDSLSIPTRIKGLIIEGKQEGERSEAMISVLNALVGAEVPDEQILYLFETYPIGEKYLEKAAHRESWLMRQIEDAREYVEGHRPAFDSSRILETLGDGERSDSLLFIEMYKERLCFDHSIGQWLKWAGHHWEEDITGNALAAVDAIGDAFGREARQQKWILMQHAKKSNADGMRTAAELEKKLLERKRKTEDLKRRESILTLAASGPDSLGITGKEWDGDPWLLGCANGVIDLRDGSFRDGCPVDFMRTASPAEFEGLECPAPHFEQFLSEVFRDNVELLGHIQRLFGYSLFGETKEHILPILYGQGRNGKGTLLEVLKYVLGPLAGPIRSETLLDTKYSQGGASHTADIMILRGKRLVWASETDEGRHFSVGKVKWLVGGDTLVGRPPHGKRFIEFRPTHTLFLLTNSKPHASAEDFAFWQRVHLIPFELSFVDNPAKANERKRDADLLTKLKGERSGILAWLVRGCLEWQKVGLNPPDIVKAATNEYQQEEDVVGRFIEESCIVGEGAVARANLLYDAYRNWCKDNGHRYLNSTNFGKRVGERFAKKKSNGVLYLGIGLSGEQTGTIGEEDTPPF